MLGMRTGTALEDSSSASPVVRVDCGGGERVTAMHLGQDVVLGEVVAIGQTQAGGWIVVASPDSGGQLDAPPPPPPPT